MQKEEQDLRDRTKAFALRIVRMFSALPKATEAQVLGNSGSVMFEGRDLVTSLQELTRAPKAYR
jgi:hypothetical protein